MTKEWMQLSERCVTPLHKSTITEPVLAISRQVPFLVINSPNSLDRNVESSDLARSFLTSLILAPLSPEFSAVDLSTRVRGTICSLCAASETVRSSRENFSREVMPAFSSTVSSSLEKVKRTLICVFAGWQETGFLIKIEMFKRKSHKSTREKNQSVDFFAKFRVDRNYASHVQT